MVGGGGLTTLSCTGLGTVPTGFTLTAINIGVTDDAQAPFDANSLIQWTWNMTGGPQVTAAASATVNQETAATSTTFNNCATITAGSPAIGCDDNNNFALLTPLGAGSAIPSIVFTVASLAATGDGLAVFGNSSASLSYALALTPNVTHPGADHLRARRWRVARLGSPSQEGHSLVRVLPSS